VLKRLFGIVAATIFSFCMQGLAWAGSGIVITNPSFYPDVNYYDITGWTLSHVFRPGSGVEGGLVASSGWIPSPYAAPTGNHYAAYWTCDNYCPTDQTITLTQQISGLTYGKSYEI
jgi:hypothetical protein